MFLIKKLETKFTREKKKIISTKLKNLFSACCKNPQRERVIRQPVIFHSPHKPIAHTHSSHTTPTTTTTQPPKSKTKTNTVNPANPQSPPATITHSPASTVNPNPKSTHHQPPPVQTTTKSQNPAIKQPITKQPLKPSHRKTQPPKTTLGKRSTRQIIQTNEPVKLDIFCKRFQ